MHVGVSSLASGLTLEVQAHRSGYCRQDTQGKVPPRNEISSGKAEVIQPLFDVEDVCKAVHKSNIRVPTCCSADAGRCVFHLLQVFGPSREEVTGDCRTLSNEEQHDLYSFAKYYSSDEMKDDEMDRSCGMCAEEEKYT